MALSKKHLRGRPPHSPTTFVRRNMMHRKQAVVVLHLKDVIFNREAGPHHVPSHSCNPCCRFLGTSMSPLFCYCIEIITLWSIVRFVLLSMRLFTWLLLLKDPGSVKIGQQPIFRPSKPIKCSNLHFPVGTNTTVTKLYLDCLCAVASSPNMAMAKVFVSSLAENDSLNLGDLGHKLDCSSQS